MFVKLIVCQVPEETRDRFTAGQRQWAALAGVDGFLGQVGGWQPSKATPADDAAEHTAVIVGLWRDEDAYDHFMSDVHDSIFNANDQRGSYGAIDVTRWRRLLDIPGERATMPAAIAGGALLRLAHCTVRGERVDHFIEVQQRLWNLSMAAAVGMLAGAFSVSDSEPRQYLVGTLWRSEDAHARYVTEDLPGLRDRSDVEIDCESLTGYAVPLEEAWGVTPA